METKKLLKEIEKLRAKWDERSQFKIKGIKNLSPADLDTIELYVEYAEKNSSTGMPLFHGLMKPRGDIKKVLDLYNITE